MAESMDEDMSEDQPLLQDLTCSVCRGIFRDPVLLPCTHSFCRECLQASLHYNRKCPLCREVFEEGHDISNRALSGACETFLKYSNLGLTQKRAGEDTCNLHMKPLVLYCEKDEEPVCVDCVSLHNTHKLWPLKEGAPICKVKCSHLFHWMSRQNMYFLIKQNVFCNV